MSTPTYRDLLAILLQAPDEVLEQNITCHDGQHDEYLPALEVSLTDGADGVLDEGHLLISC